MKHRFTICFIVIFLLVHSVCAYGASNSVTEIVGTIDSGVIKATVPIVCTFLINPSLEGKKAFSSGELNILNLSAFPLKVEAVSLKALEDNPLKIIDSNTYTDNQWKSLGKVASSTEIALGFRQLEVSNNISSEVQISDFYFLEESLQVTPISLFTLGISDTGYMTLQAKFGRAFTNSTTCNYQCILKFSMKE